MVLVGAPRSGATVVAQALRTVVPTEVVGIHWDGMHLAVPPDQLDPDAHVVLVVRHPVPGVSSLLTAWLSGRFTIDQELPGWWGEPWSFVLLPEWEDLIGKPAVTVCVRQWATYLERAMALVGSLPLERWSVVAFEEFLDDPAATVEALLEDVGLTFEVPDVLALAPTGTAVTPPGRQHWVQRRSEIEGELSSYTEVGDRLLTLVRLKRPSFEWPALPGPPTRKRTMKPSADTPFESQFTPAVTQILYQARRSLAISTYRSGHVIVARATQGQLDTEFLHVPRAMGIAVAGNRLAVGADTSIKSFAATGSLGRHIQSPVPIDRVYTPRSETHTGDIAIHDMSYDKSGDLYFVNTKFSCLCVQDLHHSFVPVWRPWWITALTPEDRCHLNGLALVDGDPRYVTVLAQTDEGGGWREHRGTGGMLIDITTNTVVAAGLSMPHSPRWHGDTLWLLESGKGALCRVDVASGQVAEVVRLPGFTRGLSFIGKYAFVGLSQVRESVFSGLPVTETAAERNCGVWVVDTQAGAVVGALKFSGLVHELFEVAVLPAAWPTVIGPDALAAHNYVLPTSAIQDVPEALRSNS